MGVTTILKNILEARFAWASGVCMDDFIFVIVPRRRATCLEYYAPIGQLDTFIILRVEHVHSFVVQLEFHGSILFRMKIKFLRKWNK